MTQQRTSYNFINFFLVAFLWCFGHRLTAHIAQFLDCSSIIRMIIIAYLCLCSCLSNHTALKHTSFNHARTKEGYNTWAQYGAPTLVKQTGVLGSNVLGVGMDCLVWVHPKWLLGLACCYSSNSVIFTQGLINTPNSLKCVNISSVSVECEFNKHICLQRVDFSYKGVNFLSLYSGCRVVLIVKLTSYHNMNYHINQHWCYYWNL